MTEIQRTIILVSLIGTVLSTYEEDELSESTRELKNTCIRFSNKQSGVEMVLVRGKFGRRGLAPEVTNQKRHDQYIETMKIGNAIWQKALDKYGKGSIHFDAVTYVHAIYSFAPDLLHKHARISKEKIDAYMAGWIDGKQSSRNNGAWIGGYLTELLAAEMGMKINGRLRALKQKVEMERGVA
ncbi:hypothetical protein [Sulfuricurvum sp.]|uniref:hypothetical protein n=1 Tax=Sulfuricurvum sp. TaxID=2025608 RepID=UPI00261739D3|nr:hypothetical protein [Sulfuricurvum sp.]MDD2267484.1 hypothetical protein [Sulfuricurvum sp.]MDD2783968.1 hypothetical protein [Sulfuricurvum sp.]